MTTYTYTNTLEVLECGVCHIEHAIPMSLYKDAQNGGNWWCPAGHQLHFIDPELNRLRRALRDEQNRALVKSRQLEFERRSHAATKGHQTRLKNRIANGICPCCNRSFVSLERHMKLQHPTFLEPA